MRKSVRPNRCRAYTQHPDSKSAAARHASSSLAAGTKDIANASARSLPHRFRNHFRNHFRNGGVMADQNDNINHAIGHLHVVLIDWMREHLLEFSAAMDAAQIVTPQALMLTVEDITAQMVKASLAPLNIALFLTGRDDRT